MLTPKPGGNGQNIGRVLWESCPVTGDGDRENCPVKPFKFWGIMIFEIVAYKYINNK